MKPITNLIDLKQPVQKLLHEMEGRAGTTINLPSMKIRRYLSCTIDK